jgi:Rod binding domain-containing protein
MDLLPAGIYSSIEQKTSGKEDQIKAAERGGKESDFKQVAKDMESLFAYQLLKVMRETSESMSSDEKGQGHDTYMSLFDMELSRIFAERGLGLADSIVRSMSRMEKIDNEGNE